MPPLRDRGVAQSFDSCADVFAELLELGPDAVGARLREGWLPGGETAIDVGCGAGRHTALLAEQYEDVLGIDVSEEMLRHARPHDRARYERCDLFDVTGEHDLVFSVTTLHHVDVRSALVHLRSLVAPGGTVAIVDCVRALPPILWNRWTLRAMNVLDLVVETAQRDPKARARFRLKRDRAWIDHMATDRYPSMEEWRDMCAEVLPGSTVEPASGFVWIQFRASPQR